MSAASPSLDESKATKDSEPREPIGLESIYGRSVIDQGHSSKMSYLKWYFTSKEGWLGDYVGDDILFRLASGCESQSRPPDYKDHKTPFYGLNDEVPILLTIILGLQHALCMIGSIVSPPLAIAGGAFYLDSATTQYLVSAAFITTGIATALQVTRVHLTKTPFFIGTGLLSVVGPTFDILPIAFNYTSMRYKNGTCPTAADGTPLPCPDALGSHTRIHAVHSLGTDIDELRTAKDPEQTLPKGSNRQLVVAVTVMVARASTHCVLTRQPLSPCIVNERGHPKLIGLGFTVFVSIVLVEQFGSPLMKSSSVIIGLFVGCLVSGLTGYWSMSNIQAATAATFLWVHTFKLSVDGALILPLLIMFVCEAVSCMPDILATAEISNVDIEGTEFNSRVQGGILCDGLGSLISTLGTGPPMISLRSQADGGAIGNLWKIRGGVWLDASIGPRRHASFPLFHDSLALGIGFLDIVQPDWFSQMLTYDGDNVALAGFEQGINLIVETPFIIAAVIGVFLNLVLPQDASEMDDFIKDQSGHAVMEKQS
ncbi:purine permease [Apiospora aurea]|uniref:Purine permease n=1 Tax=Apiospora aurea TaxID=335848 RepID=A0ABR1QU67_9PEZI